MEHTYLVNVQGGAEAEGRDGSGSRADRRDVLRRIERQGAEVEDQGGYVRVVVDHCGRVKSVWLDPRLSATPLDKLAPHIAAVCAKAFDQRLAEINRIVAENAECLGRSVVDEVAAMTARLGRPQQQPTLGRQAPAVPVVGTRVPEQLEHVIESVLPTLDS